MCKLDLSFNIDNEFNQQTKEDDKKIALGCPKAKDGKIPPDATKHRANITLKAGESTTVTIHPDSIEKHKNVDGYWIRIENSFFQYCKFPYNEHRDNDSKFRKFFFRKPHVTASDDNPTLPLWELTISNNGKMSTTKLEKVKRFFKWISSLCQSGNGDANDAITIGEKP